jgi:hypothetical protein
MLKSRAVNSSKMVYLPDNPSEHLISDLITYRLRCCKTKIIQLSIHSSLTIWSKKFVVQLLSTKLTTPTSCISPPIQPRVKILRLTPGMKVSNHCWRACGEKKPAILCSLCIHQILYTTGTLRSTPTSPQQKSQSAVPIDAEGKHIVLQQHSRDLCCSYSKFKYLSEPIEIHLFDPQTKITGTIVGEVAGCFRA